MKISDLESTRAGAILAINPTQMVGASSEAQAGTNSGAGGPAAKVELSQPAQTIASAVQAVNAVPDVREDLVSKIKAQVDAGTYHVSGNDIADQMMRRAQADKIGNA